MKPLAVTDYKADMSVSDMTPIEIVQPDGEKKKGISYKQVLIAVTVVLAVAIVVAGFVTGFYLMKKSSDLHSDNMTKIFRMKFKYGNEEVDENVKTNTKDKTTEEDTKDDKGQDSKVYHDFKKGLTVFVLNGEGGACFVSPLNRSSIDDPESQQKYLETHPNPKADAKDAQEEDHELTPADKPIPDTSFLGSKINQMCSGKNIYWMYPKPEARDNSRQKRACFIFYRTICVYRYRFGRLYRYCYRIRYVRCI